MNNKGYKTVSVVDASINDYVLIDNEPHQVIEYNNGGSGIGLRNVSTSQTYAWTPRPLTGALKILPIKCECVLDIDDDWGKIKRLGLSFIDPSVHDEAQLLFNDGGLRLFIDVYGGALPSIITDYRVIID